MDSTRSILLVEEDDAARAFLADNLTADGYALIVAADKTGAVKQLQLAPDLVVCDVNGDTLALLDAVRQADGLASKIDPATPLIVLTAHADAMADGDRARRRSPGTDHRLPAADRRAIPIPRWIDLTDEDGPPSCGPTAIVARWISVRRPDQAQWRGKTLSVGIGLMTCGLIGRVWIIGCVDLTPISPK